MTPNTPPTAAAAPTIDPANPRVTTFPTGTRAEFPYPVCTALPVPGALDGPDVVVLVVLLDVPPGGNFNNNVFGMRRDGRVAWQIDVMGPIGDDSPYMGVAWDGGRVRCGNWSGFAVWLDPTTGAELNRRFTK